jgi:hypothetical protein
VAAGAGRGGGGHARGVGEAGVLLTDLRPPLECEDPLQHVLDRLVSMPAAEVTVAGLRAIRQDLTAYAHHPLGRRRGALEAAQVRRRVLNAYDRPVQVDLALDAQDLAAFAPEPATGARQDSVAPASTEVCFQLLADSVAALDSGDFRLVAPRLLVSPVAAAAWGRFAYLLPDVARELGALAAQAVTDNPDLLPVQLSCQVRRARHANVTQTPQWLEHTLAVGTFADRSDPAWCPSPSSPGARSERTSTWCPYLTRWPRTG